MEYKFFKQRHPEYNDRLWGKCRSFYSGGEQLTCDKKLMNEVFPKHLAEEEWVYEERCKRAYYIPYAGEIIDAILSALFNEPLKIRFDPENVDPYYEKFFEDTSPPQGRHVSLNKLLKEQLLTALICKRAWTLVDLPDAPPDFEEPHSLIDEEKTGALDGYACPIDPEMVLDWEVSENDELLWALILHKECKRLALNETRDTIREEYTLYTQDRWERYVVEYLKEKEPKPSDDIPIADEGELSFGRVPLLRLELSDGLWAMGKILPIAIAHFNLRNALNWAECKSLFPVLIAKLGEEQLGNPATEDPGRATNQTYGQGRIVTFGQNDDLKYVGPDSAPYQISMDDLSNLRDEMHRVLHHMALSVDNSAAALQRSADSKQVDQAATAIILRALGQFVREHAEDIYEYLAYGRKDKNINAIADGLEAFNEQSVEALVEQATKVASIHIPSATFKKRWDYRLARRLLADDAEEADLEQIKQELEQNIANEDFLPEIDMSAAEPIDEYLGDDEDEDDEDDDARPRTGFSTKRTQRPM